MSIDRIYGIPTASAQWDELNPQPNQTVLIATNATESAFLVGSGGFAEWDALGTAYLIGSWDSETGLQEGQSWDDSEPPVVVGTPTHPATADYLEWIRPLGNEEGRATGLLDSMRWAGHAEPKFLQDDNRYPSTNTPFSLEIYRENIGVGASAWDSVTQFFTGDYATNGGSTWRALQDSLNQTPFGGSTFWEFVNTPGWGWSVEMLSADPLRDITARAISVYSDPECTLFLYTTGAFVQDGSHGNNFYTQCPVGQRTPTAAQVNFALLLGAAQEGFMNIPEGTEALESLFWAADQ